MNDIERKRLLDRLKEVKKKKVHALRIKQEYMESHLWEFHETFLWQSMVPDRIRKNMIILAPAPNGIGKTAELACMICSWMEGYEAWNKVEKDYPGAVKRGDKYYKPSSLGKVPPVRIRLTGEDWDHHLGQTVVPELKKWFPMENYETKRNTSGVEYFWTHKHNRSTLEMMTHSQKIKLFEGWRGDAWAADEPPPYEVFKAMARGLAENHGKILFFTTPLSQAWMLDQLVLSNRTDTDVVKDLLLYDNEISYANDNGILEELGLAGKVTRFWREADGEKKEFFDLILYKDDKGFAAEAFLREKAKDISGFEEKMLRLIFLKKARDTDLDEKPTRFFGMFKKLVGLVIKNFEREKHIIPSSKDERGNDCIPPDWVVTVMIDIHLSKPHAISFFGCDKHNRHYYIDEYWINCSAEEIADLIIRKKRLDGWNINNAYIDVFSKGDNYMQNKMDVEDSYTIISDRLSEEGIYLQGAEKDKESGFRNIRTWLGGPNKLPILYFFDTLQSNGSNVHNGVLYEIQRLGFDKTGKVEKIDDDFMENLYRYTLTGTEYLAEEEFAMAEGGSSGGWLGS